MKTHPRKGSLLSVILEQFPACLLACALLCVTPASAAPVFETVYSWAAPSPSAYPQSGLIQATDGNFYGTTGYSTNPGTIYKVTPAGVLTTLVVFTGSGPGKNGTDPHGGLVQGTDGNFYGTTADGGEFGFGTIFKMTPAGVLTTLVAFTDNGASNKGATPEAALVQRTDGNFYGTTSYGGNFDGGTAFKVTPAGVLTTLVHFGNGNGLYPVGGLTKGADGNLYGTTYAGGANGFGTVFKTTPTGTLTTLLSFTSDGATRKGANPYAGLVQGTDNNFYGTTQLGGTTNEGTIFKVTPSGTLTTLVQFTGIGGAKRGAFPNAALIQGTDGNFYGSTPSGGANNQGTIFKMTPAGALTTLKDSDSSTSGTVTYARLLQGSDGKFYGPTATGGLGSQGTVFKMTSTGVVTTLVNFGLNATGKGPGALVKNTDGNFYGRTAFGGPNGKGTVFKLTPFGVLTTLVKLSSSAGPVFTESLTLGTDGNFYGVKLSGLFQMTPTGVITTLGSATPYSGSALIQATDGNFYGTAPSLGGVSTGSDIGVAFRYTPGGVQTILAKFLRDIYVNLGIKPGGLLQATDGNFYGTTEDGPNPDDNGSVFKMTPTGRLSTLATFPGYHSEIIRATNGNLYGTTPYDGASFFGNGTAFRLTLAGVMTTIATFDSTTTGASPIGRLVQRSDGNFYGVTTSGGENFQGTFFRMTLGGTLTALFDLTAENRTFMNTYSPTSRLNLIPGDDGNYYASTVAGGDDGVGGVFRIRFGPTPVTKVATNITSSSAVLHGTVNPNGLATTVTFLIGTAANLAGATSVSVTTLPADNTVHSVGKAVTALLASKKYYFRVVGKNNDNTIAQPGAILSFTTQR